MKKSTLPYYKANQKSKLFLELIYPNLFNIEFETKFLTKKEKNDLKNQIVSIDPGNILRNNDLNGLDLSIFGYSGNIEFNANLDKNNLILPFEALLKIHNKKINIIIKPHNKNGSVYLEMKLIDVNIWMASGDLLNYNFNNTDSNSIPTTYHGSIEYRDIQIKNAKGQIILDTIKEREKTRSESISFSSSLKKLDLPKTTKNKKGNIH